jgi:hypothetical protein
MKPMSDKKATWWEKQRQRGKWFWIIKTTLIWALGMLLTFLLFYWFYGRDLFFVIFSFPFLILGGFIVGFVNWNSNEGNYQIYLLDKKIKENLKF